MFLPILTAALLAAGTEAGGEGSAPPPPPAGMPSDSATAARSGAGPSEADSLEDARTDGKRVVVRFRTVAPGKGKRPSAWSGTGRTWVWVGAAGLGLTGAVLSYHYFAEGEVPEDKVISLTD